MLGISCDAMRLSHDGAYIVIYSLHGFASAEAMAVDLSGDSDGVADDAGEPGAQAGDGAEGSAGQAGYYLIDLSVEPPTVKFLFAGSPAFDLGFSLRKE